MSNPHLRVHVQPKCISQNILKAVSHLRDIAATGGHANDRRRKDTVGGLILKNKPTKKSDADSFSLSFFLFPRAQRKSVHSGLNKANLKTRRIC